jgi:hypothetical protein
VEDVRVDLEAGELGKLDGMVSDTSRASPDKDGIGRALGERR